MSAKTKFTGLRIALVALAAGLAPASVLAAGHFSGGSVGGHYASGGYHGGHYAGGYRGYGWRGYGGYGWRGGYGGYWGWRGGYGWGWWGWPGGLFLASLPFYYSTLWWDGVPYYYADDNYYVWSNSANGYVSVIPPEGLASQAPSGAVPPGGAMQPGAPPPGAGTPYPGAPGGGTDLFVYPKNSQSEAQIAQDRRECQAWAASQAGAGSRGDNLRAQTACLEARGYSVK